MYRALVVFALIGALFVSGCNPVEHRSEAVPKKDLAPLTTHRISPSLVWSSKEGNGAKSDARLRLAVSPEAIYTADSKGIVRAQAKNTGKVLWSVKTQSMISSGPTLIQDVLLVGTRDKGLVAYSASAGHLLWQVPMTGEVLASPNGDRGMVFVHSIDGAIAALGLYDGKLLWRNTYSVPPIVLRHNSKPLIVGHHVVVGFSNGRLLSLHRMDGSQQWERELAIPRGRSDIQRMTDISADPEHHQGIIYVVGYQGRLAALDAETGSPIWEREMSSFSGLAVSSAQVVVSNAKGHVIAVNRRTGKTLWEQDALQGRRLTKPAVWGNMVIVGDDDGDLHWLSAEDGSFLSRTTVDSKGIEASPVVVNDVLYALGRGGKLAAYRLQTTN